MEYNEWHAFRLEAAASLVMRGYGYSSVQIAWSRFAGGQVVATATGSRYGELAKFEGQGQTPWSAYKSLIENIFRDAEYVG